MAKQRSKKGGSMLGKLASLGLVSAAVRYMSKPENQERMMSFMNNAREQVSNQVSQLRRPKHAEST